MSTQINLTIGDQRLLQTAKTRGAANQQALDDRTANKQTAVKAEEQVAATQEERPGASVNNNLARRPTAQRERKDTASIYSVNGVNLVTDPTTDQTFSQEWTAYGIRVFSSNTFPYPPESYTIYTQTRFNNYNINNKYIQPLFGKQVGSGTQYTSGYKHDVFNNVDALTWTLRQRALAVPELDLDYTNASPPQINFLFENKVYFARNFSPFLVSADTSKIYLSVQIIYGSPDTAVLRTSDFAKSIYDPTAYETDTGFQGFLARAQHLRRTANQLSRILTYTYLYWTYDLKTKEVSFRKETALQYPGDLSPLDVFVKNLNTADPYYNLWQVHKSTYTGVSDRTIAVSFLYSSGAVPAFYKKWPPGLLYDKQTGAATLTTQTTTSLYFCLFTINLPKNLDYTTVTSYLPSTYDVANVRAQDLLAAGWTFKQELQNTPVSSPFAFTTL